MYFGRDVGVWIQSGSGAVKWTVALDYAMVMMQVLKDSDPLLTITSVLKQEPLYVKDEPCLRHSAQLYLAQEN